MLKKILIVLGVLIVIVVAIIVIVFQMTAGIVDVTESFFADIKAGNIDLAYETFVSDEFKATTSKDQLAAFLNESTLSDYADATWDSRAIENNQGTLEGSIITSDGGTVPLTISLVRENEEWKILAISLDRAGLTTESSEPPIPDDSELQRLTGESVYNLALAINAEDFTTFYSTIAVFWQNQTTVDELSQAFVSFVEQDVDLTGIADAEPIFNSPPAINENGFLKAVGYFPTQPAMVHFDLSYTYEHPDWKLVGINIQTK